MRGKHEVRVHNNRVQYRFTLNRNITMLRGDSATGKTTLIEMVAEYARDGKASGVTLVCDKPCRVLGEDNWEIILPSIKDSIVFIDESAGYMRTPLFAQLVRESNNYYVIASRDPLPTLPYSVEEVYGIKNKTRSKRAGISRVYSQFNKLYAVSPDERTEIPANLDFVIVEDSNSGFEFFSNYFSAKGIACVSARGKARISRAIVEQPKESSLLVIADGAAFGPEIDSVLKLGRARSISLFLPESFEWLILRSGVVRAASIEEVLANPSDHIESSEYFSWEQFFTAYLTEATEGGMLRYSKSKLNGAYLAPGNVERILENTPFEAGKVFSDEVRSEV